MKKVEMFFVVMSILFGCVSVVANNFVAFLTVYTNNAGTSVTKQYVISNCSGLGNTCAVKYVDGHFFSYYFFN